MAGGLCRPLSPCPGSGQYWVLEPSPAPFAALRPCRPLRGQPGAAPAGGGVVGLAFRPLGGVMVLLASR